jgi:hypothetical protein
MILAEAGEIFAYWADHPPPHLLLQAIVGALGWRPPAPADTARLVEAPPPGLVVAAGIAATPAPVFDLDALRDRNRARAAAIAQRNAAT